MKNNQVLKIGKYGDHDLARLALRERLNSMLQFGRVLLKDGEAKPRYDVKSGKGVITRADGTVIFEASLAGLVETGEQVRLALVAYNRVLRERGILQYVRDNRDLHKLVNIAGSEVVLFGFDSRSKKRVQRYQLVRDIVLSDIGVTLTALPKKLSDAVELGKQVEANFLAQLEAAKGDSAKTAQLEKLGVELGVLKATAVPAPKPKAKVETEKSAEAKPGKKRRRKRGRKGGAAAISPTVQTATPAPEATASADAPATSETKKKRRRRPRNRKPKAVVTQASSESATEAQSAETQS
ncbi:MAG: hypothetical protein K2Y22_06320 [Candidatus Obscuribacterales bacterium]|nr:hypothetical protein [Candidatus Obscuribacterales bacterium]